MIKDHILKGKIVHIFVPLHDEIVDVLTKEFVSTKLTGFLEILGMINPDPLVFLESINFAVYKVFATNK